MRKIAILNLFTLVSTACALSLPPTRDAASRFLAGWPVAMDVSPFGGHGLFATQPIAAGTRALCVPHARTLTRQFLFDAGLVPLLEPLRARGNISGVDLMTLGVARLLYDTAADPWLVAKYGDAAALWPKDHSHVGGTWRAADPDPDADLVDIPRLPVYVRETFERWYTDHVRPVIEAHGAFFGSPVRAAYGLEQFIQARAVVTSRGYGRASFGFQFSPEEENYGLMIPGLDLLNHPPRRSANLDTSVVPRREHGHCLIANRDFSAGEELYSAYGERDSFVRVFQYGFRGDVALETDVVPIPLRFSGATTLTHWFL
jgi:hypothetical protein